MGILFNRNKQDARKNGRAQREHFAPFKLASYEHDHEGKKFKSSKVVFSFWSATKYVFILSLVLWWLPMFGQMIAGYVGGRRAGGPWKMDVRFICTMAQEGVNGPGLELFDDKAVKARGDNTKFAALCQKIAFKRGHAHKKSALLK